MGPKPLMVLLVFVFFIAVFAGGMMGDVDLSQGGQSQPSSANPALTNNQNNATVVSAASSNACGNSYTVKSGDTLSRIAQSCGISLKNLLAVNPFIANPNIIRVGQKITIPNNTPPLSPKPTLTQTPTIAPTATPKPGLKAGNAVNVEVKAFPPNVEVQVAIGQVGFFPTVVNKGKTDANGVYKVAVIIPKKAKLNEKWTVTIITEQKPKMQVTAEPFVIAE